jgi:hypothetical protein
VKRKMLYSIDWKSTSLKMQLCRNFNKNLRFFSHLFTISRQTR